ncbi:type I methionyl aminopeptidase [Streptacidiphilus albus]|uniref:type I methionyl aminopeptidase n=1 Tax=Streptacidiphilus albus TaxID=105425 RepID=UPI00054B4690|nr:type I methionyl aminopeptidase [Streptacidiphilus albus]
MVEIKTPEQIAKMREAGLIVAEALAACREAVAPGVTTRELDAIAAKVISDRGAKSNFLGYHGFPGVICASVNDEVVHGIPGDRRLENGDMISIDCGAIVDGWHGDSAITVLVGEGHPEELVALSRVTEESMWAGIAQVKKNNRLSDLSRAIESYIRRQPLPPKGKYGIIEDFGGHGIGSEMHMDPHLLNYVDRRRGRGPKLVPGFCIAIEPMVSLGTPRTHTLEDEWTVKTNDGTWASHWEHSIAVTEEGPLVLTAFDGGRAKLAELGITAAPDPLA